MRCRGRAGEAPDARGGKRASTLFGSALYHFAVMLPQRRGECNGGMRENPNCGKNPHRAARPGTEPGVSPAQAQQARAAVFKHMMAPCRRGRAGPHRLRPVPVTPMRR